MNETFVLDVSALIAFFMDESGADTVETVLQKARMEECVVYMNKVNVLEIYYGVYRDDGKDKAEEVLTKVHDLPLNIVDGLADEVFKEAGRLKAEYKVSLADSIALAEAKTRKAGILTADHHEFDILEQKGELIFNWIR